MIKIKVNSKNHELDVNAQKPVLWVLREDLHLSGTKYSCGIGICGACRVDVDGELVASCTTPVSEIGDKEVTTVEGLEGKTADAVREAWLEQNVSQCGYCQPGQVMTATHLLGSNPTPSPEEVDEAMDGLCRCGSYQRIRQAVLNAATNLSSNTGKGGA